MEISVSGQDRKAPIKTVPAQRTAEQEAAEDRAAFAIMPSLPPEGIALYAEDVGVKKAHYDTLTLVVLAIMGGAYISIGALFATIVQSGADVVMAFGLTKLLGGLVFSSGLILVIVAGAQLFTSDSLLILAWASRRITAREVLRVWVLVWLGNLVGALALAVIIFLSGQYMAGHGVVGETALYYASTKANLPVGQAFFMAIMCNVLVSLGAWVAYAGRSIADKIVAIIFPISAFIAAGFEHCVANMYFVPLGLLIKWGAPDKFWTDLGHAAPSIPVDQYLLNLSVVTLGNIVGGTLCVGGMYWLAFRRPGRPRH